MTKLTKDAMKQQFGQNRSFFNDPAEQEQKQSIQAGSVTRDQNQKKKTTSQSPHLNTGKRGPLPQGVKPINEDNDWFVTSIRLSASQMEEVDNFLYENRLRSRTDSIFLLLKLGIQQYRHNPDKARKDLGL